MRAENRFRDAVKGGMSLTEAYAKFKSAADRGRRTEAPTRRASAGIFGTVADSIHWPTGNVVSLVAPMAPDIPIPRTPCPGSYFPCQT